MENLRYFIFETENDWDFCEDNWVNNEQKGWPNIFELNCCWIMCGNWEWKNKNNIKNMNRPLAEPTPFHWLRNIWFCLFYSIALSCDLTIIIFLYVKIIQKNNRLFRKNLVSWFPFLFIIYFIELYWEWHNIFFLYVKIIQNNSKSSFFFG